jgi:hypothetical protein
MVTETEMTYDDDVDIRCLLSEDTHCQFRVKLNKNFGYDIPIKCPYRVILKTVFEQYLADQDRKRNKSEYE